MTERRNGANQWSPYQYIERFRFGESGFCFYPRSDASVYGWFGTEEGEIGAALSAAHDYTVSDVECFSEWRSSIEHGFFTPAGNQTFIDDDKKPETVYSWWHSPYGDGPIDYWIASGQTPSIGYYMPFLHVFPDLLPSPYALGWKIPIQNTMDWATAANYEIRQVPARLIYRNGKPWAVMPWEVIGMGKWRGDGANNLLVACIQRHIDASNPERIYWYEVTPGSGDVREIGAKNLFNLTFDQYIVSHWPVRFSKNGAKCSTIKYQERGSDYSNQVLTYTILRLTEGAELTLSASNTTTGYTVIDQISGIDNFDFRATIDAFRNDWESAPPLGGIGGTPPDKNLNAIFQNYEQPNYTTWNITASDSAQSNETRTRLGSVPVALNYHNQDLVLATANITINFAFQLEAVFSSFQDLTLVKYFDDGIGNTAWRWEGSEGTTCGNKMSGTMSRSVVLNFSNSGRNLSLHDQDNSFFQDRIITTDGHTWDYSAKIFGGGYVCNIKGASIQPTGTFEAEVGITTMRKIRFIDAVRNIVNYQELEIISQFQVSPPDYGAGTVTGTLKMFVETPNGGPSSDGSVLRSTIEHESQSAVQNIEPQSNDWFTLAYAGLADWEPKMANTQIAYSDLSSSRSVGYQPDHYWHRVGLASYIIDTRKTSQPWLFSEIYHLPGDWAGLIGAPIERNEYADSNTGNPLNKLSMPGGLRVFHPAGLF